MGGDPDETARNTLADMQARLASGPYAVLAIAPNASATEARSAFLELTKIYHPARFSRLSADVQRLANEIFLGIKGAHEALAKTSGWQTRGQPGAQPPVGSAPIAAPVPVAAASTRPTSAAPAPGLATGPAGARGTGARPAQPTVPTQAPAAARPVAGGSQPPRSPTGQTPTLARPPSPAPAAPARATTPPGPGAAGARPTTPSPAPGSRPGTPSPAPASRPTTPAPAAGAPRGAPQTVQPWKPSASGVTRAASPVPTAAAGTKPPAGAFDERAELMIVMDLVRKGQWPAARQALQNLAARVPGSTNYKALLAYARAREAQQANRPDEAILELQRALQLDPNLSLAKTALAELQRAKK